MRRPNDRARVVCAMVGVVHHCACAIDSFQAGVVSLAAILSIHAYTTARTRWFASSIIVLYTLYLKPYYVV